MTNPFFRLMPWTLLAVSFAVASENEQLVVPSGSVLRSQLEDGVRLKLGAPVSAVLTDPLYVGRTLAVPQGALVKGHVASIHALPFRMRTRRLLGGDLTPPKTARIKFDQIVLADGTAMPISTDATIGFRGMRNVVYAPDKPRPGIRQILARATRPLREPKKLQRFGQAAVKTLPYHPEFLDRGAVFDATLLTELKTSVPAQSAEIQRNSEAGLLHVHLLTPLSSSSNPNDTTVKAMVFRPYYGADGVLRFPEGTMLDGTVSNASPSGRWKKHGSLRFEFHSAAIPGGETTPLNASVAGIQAAHSHSLSVDQEGDIDAKNSRVAQVLALTSLAGPLVAATDSGANKTAFDRAGLGVSGFGLIGAGAAQASSSTATSFGFFGAAMRIYDAFLAHGAEIELPKNTPVLLRIDQ